MSKFHCVILMAGLGLLLAAKYPSSDESFQDFTVMSFNLRNSNMGDRGERAWSQRKPTAMATIREQGPDIVGFQEVSPRQRLDLETTLVGYHSRGEGRDGQGRGEQCPVFFKMDRRARDSGTFWLSPTPDVPSKGWDARLKRICTWVSFEGLTVFNTHLDHEGERARREGLRLIAEKARGSVVVLGDLNDRPGAPALEPIRQLIDAYEYLHPQSRDFTTYHAFRGAEKKVGPRLDYIFVSPDIEVVSVKIVESAGSRLPSDHSALVAHLRKRL